MSREPVDESGRPTDMPVLRRLAAITLIASVLCAVSVADGSTVGACGCDVPPLADYADDVVAAFVGVQTDRIVDDLIADDGATLTFDVEQVHAGDVTSPFTVRTPAQDSACGIDLAGRGMVAVVATDYRGEPIVGLCGSVVDVDELVAVFGPGASPSTVPSGTTAPPDESGSSWPARAGLGAILIGIVVAGTWFAIRARRGNDA